MPLQTASVAVSGMTCASCVAAVETALQETPGVARASVNLLLEKATVTFDTDKTTVEGVVEAVSGLGYPATALAEDTTTAVDFVIKGMFCSACPTTIENALVEVPGVSKASVNYVTSKGRVECEHGMVPIRTLMETIRAIGFEATLAPEEDGRADAQRAETARLGRLFWGSCALSAPVLFFAMVFPFIDELAFLDEPLTRSTDTTWSHLVQFLLATPVQFVFGKPFYVGSYHALRRGSPNMEVLVSLGTTAAYLLSVVTMFAFNDVEGGHDGSFLHGDGVGVFFETSALLITFVHLGKYLESVAKRKTGNAVHALLDMRAKTAHVVQPDGDVDVNIRLLQLDDIVRILPGEKIPCDAVVCEGTSSVDESMITGESVPVPKECGSEVIGGTTNGLGMLLARATRVGTDTTLHQIVRLVVDAQTSKAPIQAMVDRVSAVFVPVVVLISVAAFAIWMPLFATGTVPDSWRYENMSDFAHALFFAISVLVIACPCALGLATPTAVMVGTGLGARNGILIKGGQPLQVTHKLDAIVFDKTGTLTTGKFQVVTIQSFGSRSKDEVLQTIAAAESGSEHPIGQAIVRHASAVMSNVKLQAMSDFEAVPGKGLRCSVAGQVVYVGTRHWMLANEIAVPQQVDAALAQHQIDGHTAVLVGIRRQVVGLVALGDTPRPESRDVVCRLRQRGIEVWMMTGDNSKTAAAIGAQVGIEPAFIFGDVLPHHKAKMICDLHDRGLCVGMVGDGVNDSPALAEADVGIAIGGGSEVAFEAAGVVLLSSSLWGVLSAIDLARITFRRIRLNLFWAFVYNSLGIPIAAGVLYPFVHIILPPMLAGFAMAMSSVSVVVSSLSLSRARLPKYE